MSQDGSSKEPMPDFEAKQRPRLLTVLCLFSYTWFGLLSILSLLLMFIPGRISEIRGLYIPGNHLMAWQLFLIFLTWFLLNTSAFIATFLIWTRKKRGYFLMLGSCLIILIAGIWFHEIVPGAWIVNIVMAGSFGLFYRKSL